ncbi:MAG: hypothetical protein GWN41_11085 [Phycisphaerae bacterium]|nr:hypothetical protein [Phycisphaerae bacterium]
MWPEGISDGLTLPCIDCGKVPRFDYRVKATFWKRWGVGADVLCLPCLDRRCEGQGLADALEEIQWTGTGHTVCLKPFQKHAYGGT